MAYTNIDIEKKYVKMKQDVYEHLAKTFLDKKDKKSFKQKNRKTFLIFAIIVISFVTLYVLSHTIIRKHIFSKSLYVISDKTPVVIEYNFSTPGNAKIKVLSFNLNNIDLSEFSFLELSLRTEEKTKIDSTIKVQIENSLLEKDAQYFSGINNSWKRFSVPLKKFQLINEWKSIKSLTFVVEDWNVSRKEGKIYLDDIRFVEK